MAQQACIMRLEEPDARKVTSGRLEKGAYEILKKAKEQLRRAKHKSEDMHTTAYL